jgi:archaellum component FlaC
MILALLISAIAFTIITTVTYVVYTKAVEYKNENAKKIQEMNDRVNDANASSSNVDNNQDMQIGMLNIRTSNVEGDVKDIRTNYATKKELTTETTAVRDSLTGMLKKRGDELQSGIDGVGARVGTIEKDYVRGSQFPFLVRDYVTPLSNNIAGVRGDMSFLRRDVVGMCNEFVSFRDKVSNMNFDNSSYVGMSNEFGARIEGISSTQSAIDSQFSTMTSQLSNVQNEFPALKTQFSTIDSRMGTFDSQLGTLSNEIPGLKTQTSTLSSQYSTLDSQFKTMGTQVQTMGTQVQLFDSQFKTLSGQVGTISNVELPGLRRQVTDLGSQYAALDTKISSLSNLSGDNSGILAFASQVSGIQGDVTTLKGDMTAMKGVTIPGMDSRITALDTKVNAYDPRIRTIDSNMGLFGTRIKAVEDANAGYTTQFASINSMLGTVEKSTIDLDAQFKTMLSDVTTMRDTSIPTLRNDLQTRFNELKTQLGSLNTQIDPNTLNGIISASNMAFSLCNVTIPQLRSSIRTIENTLATLPGLTSNVNALKDTVVPGIDTRVKSIEASMGTINTLSSDVTTTQSQMRVLSSNVVPDLSRRVDSLLTNYTNFVDTTFISLSGDTKTLQSKVGALETSTGSLGSQFATVNTSTQANASNIIGLRTEFNGIRTQYTMLMTALSNMETKGTQLDPNLLNQVSTLTSKMLTLETATLPDLRTGLQASFQFTSNVNTSLTPMRNQISTLDTQFASFSNMTMNTITPEITRLRSDLTTLGTQLNPLQASIDLVSGEMNTLNTAVMPAFSNQFGSGIVRLDDLTTGLTSRMNTAEQVSSATSNAVYGELGLLKTEDANIKSQLASMNTSFGSFGTGVSNLGTRVGTIEGQMTLVNSNVTGTRTQMSALDTQFKTLTDNLVGVASRVGVTESNERLLFGMSNAYATRLSTLETGKADRSFVTFANLPDKPGVAPYDGHTLTVGRHIDATKGWPNEGNTASKSLFMGWSGQKVVLGNNAQTGIDYASAAATNSVVSLNPMHVNKEVRVFGSDGKVCIGQTCLTEAQLKALATGGGGGAITTAFSWDGARVLTREEMFNNSMLSTGGGAVMNTQHMTTALRGRFGIVFTGTTRTNNLPGSFGRIKVPVNPAAHVRLSLLVPTDRWSSINITLCDREYGTPSLKLLTITNNFFGTGSGLSSVVTKANEPFTVTDYEWVCATVPQDIIANFITPRSELIFGINESRNSSGLLMIAGISTEQNPGGICALSMFDVRNALNGGTTSDINGTDAGILARECSAIMAAGKFCTVNIPLATISRPVIIGCVNARPAQHIYNPVVYFDEYSKNESFTLNLTNIGTFGRLINQNNGNNSSARGMLVGMDILQKCAIRDLSNTAAPYYIPVRVCASDQLIYRGWYSEIAAQGEVLHTTTSRALYLWDATEALVETTSSIFTRMTRQTATLNTSLYKAIWNGRFMMGLTGLSLTNSVPASYVRFLLPVDPSRYNTIYALVIRNDRWSQVNFTICDQQGGPARKLLTVASTTRTGYNFDGVSSFLGPNYRNSLAYAVDSTTRAMHSWVSCTIPPALLNQYRTNTNEVYIALNAGASNQELGMLWLSGIAVVPNEQGICTLGALDLHWAANGGTSIAWNNDNNAGEPLTQIPPGKVIGNIVIPVANPSVPLILAIIEHRTAQAILTPLISFVGLEWNQWFSLNFQNIGLQGRLINEREALRDPNMANERWRIPKGMLIPTNILSQIVKTNTANNNLPPYYIEARLLVPRKHFHAEWWGHLRGVYTEVAPQTETRHIDTTHTMYMWEGLKPYDTNTVGGPYSRWVAAANTVTLGNYYEIANRMWYGRHMTSMITTRSNALPVLNSFVRISMPVTLNVVNTFYLQTITGDRWQSYTLALCNSSGVPIRKLGIATNNIITGNPADGISSALGPNYVIARGYNEGTFSNAGHEWVSISIPPDLLPANLINITTNGQNQNGVFLALYVANNSHSSGQIFISGMAMSTNPYGICIVNAVDAHWAQNGGQGAVWYGNWTEGTVFQGESMATFNPAIDYTIRVPIMYRNRAVRVGLLEHRDTTGEITTIRLGTNTYTLSKSAANIGYYGRLVRERDATYRSPRAFVVPANVVAEFAQVDTTNTSYPYFLPVVFRATGTTHFRNLYTEIGDIPL